MGLGPFRAVALQSLGREEEALAVLAECLAFAASEGYVRPFVERGAPMAGLLQIAVNRGIESETARRLLSAFTLPAEDIGKLPSNLSNDRLIEPLSQREMQVLRLMDSALTNEEIGKELFVSVNTIRTHVRNIYAKLGVKRRGDAVEHAKALGLI
jgi:LuxR family maltose regulon positive regulatory protein